MNYDTIAPRFRSRGAFIKKAEEAERYLSKFNKYLLSFSDTGDLRDYILSLVQYAKLPYRLLNVALADSVEKKNDVFIFNHFSSFIISLYLDVYLRALHIKENEENNGSKSINSIATPALLGDVLMILAYIGDKETLKNILGLVLDIFDLKLIGGDETNLTQLFILRLAEKEFRFAPRKWDEDTPLCTADPMTEEPLFAALWQHWDSEDEATLTPLLIQLLNRHTFQASRNNKDGGRDFGAPATEQVPWELFFLYRLREFKGLSQPKLTHRLLQAPFDHLPTHKPWVVNSQDQHYMAVVREKFPDFDDVISSVKIRDWDVLA